MNHKNLEIQLQEAEKVRHLSWNVIEGEHHAKEHGEFKRKDYIAFALFSRVLQAHEATEIVVRNSLVDDGWVLTRAVIEYAINCAYMLLVSDDQTANDFVDYGDYASYLELKQLQTTDQQLLNSLLPPEKQEESRLRYEAVRNRFDGKRGDQWCADDRLYKRAGKVDEYIGRAKGEKRTDFLWLVNTAWRYSSSYVHGSARSLADQVKETSAGAVVHRQYTKEEAAEVVYTATLTVYFVLALIDGRLGHRNTDTIKASLETWGGVKL